MNWCRNDKKHRIKQLGFILIGLICIISVGGISAKAENVETSGNLISRSASPSKPAAPKVSGKYNKKGIKLTWKKVSGADTYYVYKKNNKGKYKKLSQTEKLYYLDKKVKKGQYYSYKVVAVSQQDGKTIKGKNSKICKILADTIDPNKKMVALTFDDGPGQYTKTIVNCLKKNDAKATFFVLGSRVSSYASVVKAADSIGCEIENHTNDHKNLVRLSDKEIKAQIRMTDQKIKKITGKTPALLRTPGGSISDRVKKSAGKPIILWSIDTRDWEHRNKDKTIKSVLNNVKDGDIVLMHDIHEPTKEAALYLIPELKRKGYQLVTVKELAKYRGNTLKKGSVYHSLRKH